MSSQQFGTCSFCAVEGMSGGHLCLFHFAVEVFGDRLRRSMWMSNVLHSDILCAAMWRVHAVCSIRLECMPNLSLGLISPWKRCVACGFAV